MLLCWIWGSLLSGTKLVGPVLLGWLSRGFSLASELLAGQSSLTSQVGLNWLDRVQPQLWLSQGLMMIDQLGPVGVLAFVGLYAIATVLLLPGSLLTLGAGLVFGVVAGSLYVFIGATLGAVLAFWVGRYLARDWVQQKLDQSPKFRAIDQAVGESGFKIVLLTRLSPVFPFVLLNYAFGITRVTLKDYLLGCVGMIPGSILFVYLGSLAGSLAQLGSVSPEANPTLDWAIRLLGFAATVAASVYITQIARKALADAVAESGSKI